MKRDWTEARAKLESEGCCRVCGTTVRVECAHVIGRARDETILNGRGGRVAWVNPDSIVPLCGPATTTATCHGRFDAHALDLLPFLTLVEQLQAVSDAGGIEAARRRIIGRRHLEVVA